MGLPPSVMAELVAAELRGFEVWPVNMPVIDTWLAIDSQWRTAALMDGRTHWLGLDYAAVRAGFQLADLDVKPAIWARVQVMERVAAATLNGVRG